MSDFDVYAGEGELEAHLEAFADENERLKKQAAAYREEWHKAGELALKYRVKIEMADDVVQAAITYVQHSRNGRFNDVSAHRDALFKAVDAYEIRME